MKDNDESWFLFQIFDHITERWSPVYCSPSKAAVKYEVLELHKRQPHRDLTVKYLGQICDGRFIQDIDLERVYAKEDEDEISKARANV